MIFFCFWQSKGQKGIFTPKKTHCPLPLQVKWMVPYIQLHLLNFAPGTYSNSWVYLVSVLSRVWHFFPALFCWNGLTRLDIRTPDSYSILYTLQLFHSLYMQLFHSLIILTDSYSNLCTYMYSILCSYCYSTPLYVLHNTDLTPLYMTSILLIPRRGLSRRSLFFPGTYSHTWVFPSVCVILSVMFIPGFVMIMD